jgi:ligand-binding sensor domain-containing protein
MKIASRLAMRFCLYLSAFLLEASAQTKITVYTLALDPSNPSTLYAGMSDGVGLFKSTDAGTNWAAANNGLTSFLPGGGSSILSAIWALAVDPSDPSTLYAGTRRGVFKSTDRGASWTAANNGLDFRWGVATLAVDPSNPSTLYVGLFAAGELGVFKSTDGAASWAAASSGLPNRTFAAIAVDPSDSSTVYAGTYAGGLYKSIDGGTSWTPSRNGFNAGSVSALAIDSSNPSTIYAGVLGANTADTILASNIVFKSTDSGASWVGASTGLTPQALNALAIDPSNPSTLYAATGGGYFDTTGGVFKSIDGGGTWVTVGNGLPPKTGGALVIDPSNPTTLYVGTSGSGLFKSIDGGASWQPVGF